MLMGGCHCGSVRFEAVGDPITHVLCHCRDCRRSAGAPLVGWVSYLTEQVAITKGKTRTFKSSEPVVRQFCAQCGTGLFYANDLMMPGIIDVQSATFDEPEAIPAQAHVQVAEQINWMADAHALPRFDRFPPESA